MEQAVYAFRVEGKPVTCERYGFGHINKTYRIVTNWGNMYELQKINRHVFTDVPALMENIGNVTRYAAQRVIHPMEALRLGSDRGREGLVPRRGGRLLADVLPY